MSGARIWFQTGLADQARVAIAAGVDAIVAQGREAGGHVRGNDSATRTFENIREAVPASTLVLLAGGVVNGSDVATRTAIVLRTIASV